MFRAISSHIRAPLRPLPQSLTHFKIPICCHPSSQQPTRPIPNPSLPILSSPFSSHSSPSPQRHGDPLFRSRMFVVQPRLRPGPMLRAKLDEALSLANSLEEQRDGFFDTELSEKELPPHVVVQNRAPKPDTYFGLGTVDTVKCHVSAVGSEGGVDAVFVNAILTGIQQRNLERAWGKPVLDRVGLIIAIFNAHAFTKEAKLQAELASLMYKRSRLVRVRGPDGRFTFGAIGEAEVVSARGRGSGGGQGFIGGAGETELHLQRRRIGDRRKQLLDELKEVRRTRALQRAARKRHGGEKGQCMATVAVVGYTNAGKSTLVSSLTNSYLYSDDRLFATVDPKLRSVILPSGRKVLFSDTVGFISDLPVQLVEAFHATLEEVVEADLLVHVLDSTAPNIDEHRETVLDVLKQIGVSWEKLQNMIEVWNKIDLEEKVSAGECLDDGEDDEISSFLGTEDNYGASEQLSGDNNDDIVSKLSSGDHEESLDDQQSIDSDGWLLSEKEPNEQQNLLPEDPKKTENSMVSQPQYVPHVKTSAVMGVGLQELLALIDAKLESQNVVEMKITDRKWRPPKQDAGIAVEQ